MAIFDEISSHPTIGPGVTAIQIRLALYDNILAESLAEFVEYHKNRLRKHMWQFLSLREQTTNDWREDTMERNDKISRITRAWNALNVGLLVHKPTEEDRRYQQILERGFKEFADRYWEQREILESGTFGAKIRSALPKMSAMRHLRLHDGDAEVRLSDQSQRQMSFDAQLFDDNELCKSLSKRQSMSYVVQHHHVSASDATHLIPTVLAAFDAPNVRPLVSLDIELSTSRSFSGLSFKDNDCRKVGSAMRSLKIFRFSHCGPVLVRSDNETEVLRDFLAPIINAEALERLAVHTNLWNDDESVLDPAALPLVGIMKARTVWPRLSSVALDTLHINHADLTHILNCVDSAQGFVGLSKIHLTDGSWAAILDVLKQKHRWAHLTSPSGAECETMSVDEYENIFGSYSRVDNRTQEVAVSFGPKEAEIYIRGWGTINPLLAPAGHDPNLQD